MRQEMIGVLGMWHQLDHMQTICTSLQTETTPTPNFYRPDALPDAQPIVKLQPYGAIQICLLLCYYYYTTESRKSRRIKPKRTGFTWKTAVKMVLGKQGSSSRYILTCTWPVAGCRGLTSVVSLTTVTRRPLPLPSRRPRHTHCCTVPVPSVQLYPSLPRMQPAARGTAARSRPGRNVAACPWHLARACPPARPSASGDPWTGQRQTAMGWRPTARGSASTVDSGDGSWTSAATWRELWGPWHAGRSSSCSASARCRSAPGTVIVTA